MKISKWILGMAFLFISLSSLMACSVNKDNQEKRTFPDNGTYIYEPSKKDIKIIIEKQGKNTEGFDKAEKTFSLELSIKIAND